MHLRSELAFVAIFVSLFVTAAAAQTGDISVDGYVRDEVTQEPIAASRVALTTSSGDPVGSAVVTDNSGEFHLTASAPGSYLLSVERSGYQLASLPIGSLTQSNLVVALRRLIPRAGSTTSRPVSLHELSVPVKARAAFERGVAQLTKNDYSGAISQFRRAIKQSPTYYEAYTEMSIAQFHVGDSQGAEASLREAVALSQNHYAKALALLAEFLNSENRFAEAESSARQSIAADELSARGHCQLARALSGLKRPSEAEASAKRALELEPTNPLISLVLGNIHLQQRNLAAAVNDFDSYLSRVPSGAQSDLVRRSRDQAERMLETHSAASGMQGP